MRSQDNAKIKDAIQIVSLIESKMGGAAAQSIALYGYKVSQTAFMTQPEDRATDTKEAQMERYEKALLTLTQLTTEVTTRMGLTDESDNYNLENFEYQSGILQLIIELAQEAKDTLLNLINMRKRLYTIQGCLAVDP